MTKKEIIKCLMEAIEMERYEEAASYLSDDVRVKGVHLATLSKQAWIELQKNLKQGFPDLKYNLHNFNESGNAVNATAQLKGTQSEDLPPVLPGVGTILATGRKVETPKEDVVFKFKDDKIEVMEFETTAETGVPGLLNQLGVTVPV